MSRERSPKNDSAKRRQEADPAARAWFMLFLLVFSVGLMIYVDFNRRLNRVVQEVPISGRFVGDPAAELRIIQFLDFQSSESVRGQNMIEEKIRKHPQGIFLQTRYFPQEEQSLLATIYAECANQQNKFKIFVDLLFERQFQWAGFSGTTPFLKAIANEAGLHAEQLKSCTTSKEATDTVLIDRVYGESLFVKTTPTYFLNSQMVVGVDDLEKALRIWEERLTEDE